MLTMLLLAAFYILVLLGVLALLYAHGEREAELRDDERARRDK